MGKSKYLLIVTFISIIAGFGLEDAFAHSTKIAGDYKIEVGWIKEPALAGEPNAVEIVIQLASDYDKNKFDPATIQFLSQTMQEPTESDFTGIAESFDASLKFAGKTIPLSFTEMEELPGIYYSPFTPEVTGIPNLQVYGTIKNIEIGRAHV